MIYRLPLFIISRVIFITKNGNLNFEPANNLPMKYLIVVQKIFSCATNAMDSKITRLSVPYSNTD